MAVSEIELFQTLKGKLGEKETQTLVEFLKSGFHEDLEAAATKEDILRLENQVDRLGDSATSHTKRLEGEITRLETLIKTEAAQVRLSTEAKIEAGFKDQLKWLIVLLLGFSSLIITVIKLL